MGAYLQSNSATVASVATNPVVLPFAVGAGNTLVAVMSANSNSNGEMESLVITDNHGNTWIKLFSLSQTANRDIFQIWYATNVVGGPTTVTSTETIGTPQGTVWLSVSEYYGQVAASPFTVTAGGTSTAPSTGAIPISGLGVLVVAGYQNISTNLASSTVAAPFTVRQTRLLGSSSAGGSSADDTTASGSVTATWTLNTSIAWKAGAVAFQPTSSGSSGGSSSSGTGAGAPTVVSAPQVSQSGRNVVLTAVSGGNIFYSLAGTNIWNQASNGTGSTLVSSGVVRSAANNQKLYFADGTHYLYFDPKTTPPSVQSWTASFGSLPSQAANTPRLICTWRGRTVLSGITTDPQNWFMSAVGDPGNFDYFPGPAASYFGPAQAIAGNASDLGLIGDVVTCLIPHGDDVLVLGGDHTIWQFSGDPAAGGEIDLVSDTIGIAWGNPWCKGPDGTLYFVSNKTGIYSMKIGQQPIRMSGPIEQLLSDLDSGANIIRMSWDDQWQGFHTYITPAAGAAAATHLFWESRTGAWWTDVFASTVYNPLCCVTFDGNAPGDRKALIGSWDGYVRTMVPSAATDDGIAMASAVVIGPLLTKDFDEMLLKDLQAILGANSGPVNYAVYVGPTAEVALASAPVATGTWSVAGRNLTTAIRRSGHAVYVKITASNYWAQEGLRARIATQGKVRRRGY